MCECEGNARKRKKILDSLSSYVTVFVFEVSLHPWCQTLGLHSKTTRYLLTCTSPLRTAYDLNRQWILGTKIGGNNPGISLFYAFVYRYSVAIVLRISRMLSFVTGHNIRRMCIFKSWNRLLFTEPCNSYMFVPNWKKNYYINNNNKFKIVWSTVMPQGL